MKKHSKGHKLCSSLVLEKYAIYKPSCNPFLPKFGLIHQHRTMQLPKKQQGESIHNTNKIIYEMMSGDFLLSGK